MTVRRPDPSSATPRPVDSRREDGHSSLLRTIMRLLPVGLLGAGTAVLVSCGSSGAGLIPSENAGPLVAAFQAVERAASQGDGNCAPTKAALSTTEHDFQALPASVNAGLRTRLRKGISHLQTLALELCAEPLAQTTTTGESTSTTTTTAPPATTKTTTTTPPTNTTTPPTSTTTPTSTAPTGTTPSSGAEGGTAPEVGGSEGNAGEGGAGGGQGGLGSGEAAEGANNGGAAGPSGGTGSGGSGQ